MMEYSAAFYFALCCARQGGVLVVIHDTDFVTYFQSLKNKEKEISFMVLFFPFFALCFLNTDFLLSKLLFRSPHCYNITLER